MTATELQLANAILKKVSHLTGISTVAMLTRQDGKRTPHARRLAYLAMAETISLVDIAAFFSRSPSNVCYAIKAASTADRAMAARWLVEVKYMRKRRKIERAFEKLKIEYADLTEVAA